MDLVEDLEDFHQDFVFLAVPRSYSEGLGMSENMAKENEQADDGDVAKMDCSGSDEEEQAEGSDADGQEKDVEDAEDLELGRMDHATILQEKSERIAPSDIPVGSILTRSGNMLKSFEVWKRTDNVDKGLGSTAFLFCGKLHSTKSTILFHVEFHDAGGRKKLVSLCHCAKRYDCSDTLTLVEAGSVRTVYKMFEVRDHLVRECIRYSSCSDSVCSLALGVSRDLKRKLLLTRLLLLLAQDR